MFDTAIFTTSGRVALDWGDGYGHMGMDGGWGYGLMWIVPVILLVLLGLGVYLIVRASSASRPAPPSATTATATATDATASARAILAERLAEGDIEIDDYRARIAEFDGPSKPARGKRNE